MPKNKKSIAELVDVYVDIFHGEGGVRDDYPATKALWVSILNAAAEERGIGADELVEKIKPRIDKRLKKVAAKKTETNNRKKIDLLTEELELLSATVAGLSSRLDSLSDRFSDLEKECESLQTNSRSISQPKAPELRQKHIAWILVLVITMILAVVGYWLYESAKGAIAPIQLQFTWDIGQILFGALGGAAALIAAFTYRGRSSNPDSES